MDYGEGIATTGFYVALNEDDEGDMVGFSPEAVLSPPGRATGAWLHVGPVAPVSAAPPGRYPPYSKKPRTFRDGVLVKRKNKKLSLPTELLLYLMPGSSLLSHGETPHYHRRYGVSLLSSAWGQVGPPR